MSFASERNRSLCFRRRPELCRSMASVSRSAVTPGYSAVSERSSIAAASASFGRSTSNRAGHTAADAVALSPDGKLLASAGEPEVIRFWNQSNGQQTERAHRLETAPVISLAAFSFIQAHQEQSPLTVLCEHSRRSRAGFWGGTPGGHVPAGLRRPPWARDRPRPQDDKVQPQQRESRRRRQSGGGAGESGSADPGQAGQLQRLPDDGLLPGLRDVSDLSRVPDDQNKGSRLRVGTV